MEDRSLDDFFDDDSGATAEAEGDADQGEADPDVDDSDEDDQADGADDTGGPRVDPSSVEPTAATYTWSGDGGDCDACGEVVDRRWCQDDRLVCPECKDW